MKKQVYEINEEGLLQGIHVTQFDDEGNPVEDLPSNVITLDIPQGLYRPKWNGTEWLEDMLQADIDALRSVLVPPTEVELLQAEVVKLDERNVETNTQLIDLWEILIESGAI